MPKKLTVRATDVMRLAAESHRDPSTVARVIRGGGNRLSREAVAAAAKTLDIRLPTDEE
jgi:hypothetical protein